MSELSPDEVGRGRYLVRLANGLWFARLADGTETEVAFPYDGTPLALEEAAEVRRRYAQEGLKSTLFTITQGGAVEPVEIA